MKLVKLSVTNFRSITIAHRISLSETTVLVGKNNEGKSNFLTALSFAMNLLTRHARNAGTQMQNIPRVRPRYNDDRYSNRYQWERDFPLSLREKKVKKTVFELEFEFNAKDIEAFNSEIKSKLNGTLPIEITLGEDNKPVIKVKKKGRGGKALTGKSALITAFVSKRIYFNYIPAIRTHNETMYVLEEMVEKELEVLEQQKEYLDAIRAISDLQEPVLKKLAEKIKAPLSKFLPNISKVEITLEDDARRIRYRRGFDVIVDDGVATSIELKGDGVKSLAALGLLRNRLNVDSSSIIAIEEPESHLHPGAIHQLKEIINVLEPENQIVLTTHNPLFVNRSSVQSNIIVDNGKATPAKNIKDIREILGVRVSDNLTNAGFALVVEGQNDKVSLAALLPILSDKLSKVLKNNLLVIDHLGGASNLSYKLSTLDSQLCSYHVLLDHDESANNIRDIAIKSGQLKTKNLTQTTCIGMSNSEFEDCIDSGLYSDALHNKLGINIDCPQFRANKQWSLRMAEVCSSQGKSLNDDLKSKIKTIISECISGSPAKALSKHKRGAIDALVKNLGNYILETPRARCGGLAASWVRAFWAAFWALVWALTGA